MLCWNTVSLLTGNKMFWLFQLPWEKEFNHYTEILICKIVESIQPVLNMIYCPKIVQNSSLYVPTEWILTINEVLCLQCDRYHVLIEVFGLFGTGCLLLRCKLETRFLSVIIFSFATFSWSLYNGEGWWCSIFFSVAQIQPINTHFPSFTHCRH